MVEEESWGLEGALQLVYQEPDVRYQLHSCSGMASSEVAVHSPDLTQARCSFSTFLKKHL